MNTIELTGIMKKIAINTHFLGVLASDQLPIKYVGRLPAMTVINTHPSTMPGEHWLALYIDDDRVGYFFDSFGHAPEYSHFPTTIMSLLKTSCDRLEFTTRQVQDMLSTTCGQHCIFFLYHMVKGLTYEALMGKYTSNLLKNDNMVSTFTEKMAPCICKFDIYNCIQCVQSGEVFASKDKK